MTHLPKSARKMAELRAACKSLERLLEKALGAAQGRGTPTISAHDDFMTREDLEKVATINLAEYEEFLRDCGFKVGD